MVLRRGLFSILWVAVFVLPLWVLFGRAFFGAPLGLQFVAQVVLVPLLFVGQAVGTAIVVFRPSVRRARAVSWIDAGLLSLSWLGQLGLGFFLVDGGSSADGGASAFTSLVGPQALTLSRVLSAGAITLTIAAGAAVVVVGVWQAVRDARAGFQRAVVDIEKAANGGAVGPFGASSDGGSVKGAGADFGSDPDRVIRIPPRA